MMYPFQYMHSGFSAPTLHSEYRAEFCTQLGRFLTAPSDLLGILPMCPRAWDRFQNAQMIACAAVLDPWGDHILQEFVTDALAEWLVNEPASTHPH